MAESSIKTENVDVMALYVALELAKFPGHPGGADEQRLLSRREYFIETYKAIRQAYINAIS